MATSLAQAPASTGRANTRSAPDRAAAQPAGRLRQSLATAAPPVAVFILFVIAWQVFCTVLKIPHYLLPKPTDVVIAAGDKADILATALLSTFTSALIGLGLAVICGMSAALVMSQSKLVERSIYPFAILLQTIPLIAYAPLIVIWVGAGMNAVVTISFIIALFPMISNTIAGLSSTDHNLVSMFELYNANWWQRMVKLKLPAALPYIMTGLRISSGLAVIGAIIGEFIAGIGGLRGGLGYVIVSAANRLEMSYLFAAALCSSVLGLVIFIGISMVSARFLRHWHESAVQREN
ncbi:MAG TPA: ABC transporter permease [Chloroflexota bacterium]|nr:ABC transporter permease [Chloroflexota bacterium]